MVLFSNTVINKGIASLFGNRNNMNESEKLKASESSKQGASKEGRTKSKGESEPINDESALEDDISSVNDESSELGRKPVGNSDNVDLEDAYFKKLNRADDSQKKTSTESSQDTNSKSSEDPKSVIASADSDIDSANTGTDLECTLFVKNVPYSVITDRKSLKSFKKHFGPGIKSVRFRSIASSELVPRKVAFIKQKLNESRDAVNSYIVYESKDLVEKAVKNLNCSEFDGHHLFVDYAVRPRSQATKRTVFIGNLSFDATEENLYQFFIDCGPIENLRIVRDRKFNIGKGFAYVQFEDVSTVQVALMKNDTEMQGRKLRVTRCSKVTNSSQSNSGNSHGNAGKAGFVKAVAKGRPEASAAARGPNATLSTSSKGSKRTTSFKEKQTVRSKAGNPKTSKPSTGEVLEGERSKPGKLPQLNRKRKARHENGRVKKRTRNSK